jgi:16S rRNA (adenine1518-N6/adenine1519-N6)-dimethyltransferase
MSNPSGGYSRPASIAELMGKVRTKRELAELFHYLNLRPNKGLGQNFLVDHNLLAFMVRAGEVGPKDLVLDIGCGTGLLTAHLAEAAGKVIGVEVDRRVFAIASRYLEGRPNIRLICGDALASKHQLAPGLLEAAESEWASGSYEAFRVVSNLPYSIASLVLPNLLESGLPIARMVVTVQKEVAERLAGTPASGDYGALSLVVQAHAQVAVLRAVPPAVFWPRPKVESAIVSLVPQAERLGEIRDYATFVDLVRAAFAHRRKTLTNALAASHAFGDPKEIEALLARCGLAPGARAQQVDLEKYIEVADALGRRAPPHAVGALIVPLSPPEGLTPSGG